jgi:DNA polymerase-3 subunit delta'
VGYALRLVDDPAILERRTGWLDELHNLLGASLRERFAFADRVTRSKERSGQLPEMYQVWLSYWRDVLLACAGADAPLTNLDREAEIRRLAGQLNLAEARTRTADLERGLARLSANVNARLLTEVLLLDWPRVH